jgi:hypothetical protein
VLRGGFGIFYDSADNANAMSRGPYETVHNFLNAPFPLSEADLTPFPLTLTPPFVAAQQAIDPNLKLPYVYEFNASLQQSLGRNQSLTATYVGAIGRRLLRIEKFFDVNDIFQSGLTIYTDTSTSDYHSV